MLKADILERMGVIQIHHGSAGSNVVARYLASYTPVLSLISLLQRRWL